MVRVGSFDRCRKGVAYRSQHGVHELVRLFRAHQSSHLEHTECQTRNNGGMFGQGFLQQFAVLLVVV